MVIGGFLGLKSADHGRLQPSGALQPLAVRPTILATGPEQYDAKEGGEDHQVCHTVPTAAFSLASPKRCSILRARARTLFGPLAPVTTHGQLR